MSQEDPNIHTLFGVENCDLEKNKTKQNCHPEHVQEHRCDFYLSEFLNDYIIIAEGLKAVPIYVLITSWVHSLHKTGEEPVLEIKTATTLKTPITSVTRSWIPDVHLSAI